MMAYSSMHVIRPALLFGYVQLYNYCAVHMIFYVFLTSLHFRQQLSLAALCPSCIILHIQWIFRPE